MNCRFQSLLAMIPFHRLFCLLLLGCMCLSSPVLADTQDDADLASSVRKEVRRLADRDLAERDAAEQRLVELGPAALDHLPSVVDRMPEEVKHRLTRVREKLEKAHVEATLKASNLTLDTDDISLVNLLAEIQKQTGNRLADNRDDFGQASGPLEFKLNWKGTDFWPALDAALDQQDLTLYPYRDDQQLGIVVRPPGQVSRTESATYQGPFRIEPLRIQAHKNLRQEQIGGLEINVELAWEPRLQPIAVTMPLDEFKLTDDQDREIKGMSEGISPEISVSPSTKALELSIPWRLPERTAKQIAKLEGKLLILVPGRTEEFRFDNLAEANMEVQRRGGVVVTLDGVRQNNELWQAFLRIRFDEASGALESYRGWYYDNECYLVDTEGNKIEFSAFDRTRETKDEFGMGYLFDCPEGLKGLTLVYRTPAVIMNVPVTFELLDLPLP